MLNRSSLFRCAGVLVALVCSPMAFAQSPSAVPPGLLGQILAAHRLAAAPSSVRITGNVTRGRVTEPIKITATAQENALVELATAKLITTTSSRFQDKDGKITPAPTQSGFSQLDVTGVFFLAHLAARAVTVAPPVPAATPDGVRQRIHVRSNRSELHYGRLRVLDEVDVYASPDGLLTGFSRSFYDRLPRFKFTQAYAFSDYRDTSGVILPYRIDRYLKGRLLETITVTSYEFDVPAPPTLFSPRGTR